MRIHSMMSASRANGPGLRSTVWVQGCTLTCPGCQNPLTHPVSSVEDYNPERLAERIFAAAAPGTEGLTISGGEPMQQAMELYDLCRHIKARRPDWSIGIFTGYTHRELSDGDYQIYAGGIRSLMTLPAYRRIMWRKVQNNLDFAIMGRFDRTLPTGPGALVSSANQSIELFSTRYQLSDFKPLTVEFSIAADGLTTISGFPV